ncbi:MAG: glycoside hydrolase family 2 protein [Solirubrobacteraceae bacterium]
MRRVMLVLALTGVALLSAVAVRAVGVAGGSSSSSAVSSRGGGATARTSATAKTPQHPSGGRSGSAFQGAPVTLSPPAPIPLTSGWRFRADPHNTGRRQHWERGAASERSSPVAIPNDFNPQVTRASDRGTIGWYSVRFTGPRAASGRSWMVSFEEVRRNAEVWLNGRQIGTSSDPYVPFSLPATALAPGASNLLVVRVDNLYSSNSFPQDWWNWGGIVRPVTLTPVGRITLSDLGVLPQLGCGNRCGQLRVQGTLHNNSDRSLAPEIVVSSNSPGGIKLMFLHRTASIRPGGSLAISFRVPVHGPPDLWSPQRPSLYGVQVSTSAQNRVEQLNQLRVGMRSVQVRGGILYLNGQRLWLHGAAIQEDAPGRGAALTSGDIDTIVSGLRSVGANITRAHYLLSDRLLSALDAAGIMVWSQPPVDHADGLLASTGGRSRALATLRATILAQRSHPSVVIDSVGNELSPTPDTTPGTRSYISAAAQLARRLDPGAPVALDTYCYPGYPRQRIYAKLDVLGISGYFGWYTGSAGHSIVSFSGLAPFLTRTHARYPGLAIVDSEYGAEGLYDGSPAIKGTYEFQSGYLQKTLGVLDQLPFMNGSIYWTLREFAVVPGWVGGADLPPGFTPDGLHHKGLITYDGANKPAFAAAQQAFANQPSFVH